MTTMSGIICCTAIDSRSAKVFSHFDRLDWEATLEAANVNRDFPNIVTDDLISLWREAGEKQLAEADELAEFARMRREAIKMAIERCVETEQVLTKEIDRYRTSRATLQHAFCIWSLVSGSAVRLASQYGRYGYRCITALLRAEGWVVSERLDHSPDATESSGQSN